MVPQFPDRRAIVATYNAAQTACEAQGGSFSQDACVMPPPPPVPPPPPATVYTAPAISGAPGWGPYANSYDAGNCTAFVASWIQVRSDLGNAVSWGYILGYSATPRVGAIAWTTAGWAGHVALVEAISGSQVEVAEANEMGVGVTDYRWTSISEWSGFI